MRIIITERQLDVIREAANANFNLDTLSGIQRFSKRIQYCKENLGPCIGNGTSRTVFQIDDEKILKLAKNNKGVAQNEYEGTPDYYKEKLIIFPKVFQTAEDYSWIVSEFVLPAKKNDFKECLGMPFETWKTVLTALYKFHRDNKFNGESMDEDELFELCEKNKFVYELNDFLGSYNNFSIGDLYSIRNYGLAQRNGEPYIVILDSGLNDDIWHQHYSRK